MAATLDSPSLITGQALLSAIYACIFLLASRLYKSLHSARYFSAAYVFIMLAQICYSASDLSHALTYKLALSTAADACAAVGSALEFFGLQDHFNEVDQRSRRIVGVSLAIVVPLGALLMMRSRWPFDSSLLYGLYYLGIRYCMARLLFRHTERNLLVRAFAILMAAFTLYAPNQILRNLLNSHGITTVAGARIQILFLLPNIVFSWSIGFFLIFLMVQHVLRALEEESRSDPLTGKLNRRALEQVLRGELARSLRDGSSVSIAMIDLDYFKTINDSMGHAVGDQAICHVASVIEANVRPYDVFGRQGGDELMIIMPATQSPQALDIADRICSKVGEYPHIHGIPLSLSIGVAQSERDDSVDTLLRRADDALYQAKNEGRSRVRFRPFSPFLANGTP